MQSVAQPPIRIPLNRLDSVSKSAQSMDSPREVAEADELPPMAKFLCSFGGSILPRPLDGRLRYVGGETRIVTVARDISYSDFLARMRELFEGVDVIKYQQPDEDLDALVSVVNDDDVLNMMEEYDKLILAGEGFTRLRIFLFCQQLDGDAASVVGHYDGDERETERRYVDALNSLGEARSPTSPEVVDQLCGTASFDSGFPSSVSLRHLNVPRAMSVQRYGDLDSPWSPAYPSPYGAPDPREYPVSPSSARYAATVDELFTERLPEELARQQSPQIRHYDQSPTHVENMTWLPPGAVFQEKAGFPGNLGRPSAFAEGNNSVCDNCRTTFQRSQSSTNNVRYLDPRWRPVQAHFEQSSVMNEHPGRFANSCAECCSNKENYTLSPEVRAENGAFLKEQTDHQTSYNESHAYDSGWHMYSNQCSPRYEDPIMHLSGTGKTIEPYAIENNTVNSPHAHGKIYDMHSPSFNRINQDNAHHFHRGESFNEAHHYQRFGGGGSYAQIPGFEDAAASQHFSHASSNGADVFYQMQHNLAPIQSLRKVHVPHAGPPYDSPSSAIPNGSINSSFVRSTPDGSPRIPIAIYNQNPNSRPGFIDSTPLKIICPDVPASGENCSTQGSRVNANITGQDMQPCFAPELVRPGVLFMKVHPEMPCSNLMAPTCADEKIICPIAPVAHPSSKLDGAVIQKLENADNGGPLLSDEQESKLMEAMNACSKADLTEEQTRHIELSDTGNVATEGYGEISEERLSFLPELIASVKKAAMEDVEDAATQPNAGSGVAPTIDNDETKLCDVTAGNADVELEADSPGSFDHQKKSKIEPTTAEAEALAKGLQTIRNDDLEEIKELGSGTFGAVFHGKWRGSDVAIKKIKASCFAGRPSERERLIADFWKEALLLSSLHHPNVVSFYGVVRDVPDGSLATVTEFMVNGSLKQFLQKKDRTIDRRKRLILAMDAAFGMEYLHGKNIVHFDLKCENLLVNMRDPHRPICKIGDLGLSKVKQHTLVSGGIRGTLPWMAPELLSGKSSMVSEKIDVYSFGIVMWELLTGEEPYANMRCASIIGGIVNNTLRPQIPSWCDPEWKSLMESCWASDPADRPSFSEISQRLRKMAAAINLK